MMKDWDRRLDGGYALAISLNYKTIKNRGQYFSFASMDDEKKQLATLPNEIPMQVQYKVYDAEIKRVIKHGTEYAFALDEEAQEIVDVFVEIETQRYKQEACGLDNKIVRLQREIDNYTWNKVKAYFSRLLR